MADDAANEGALPPKLNLKKAIRPKTASKPRESSVSKQTPKTLKPNTSRIKLPANDEAKDDLRKPSSPPDATATPAVKPATKSKLQPSPKPKAQQSPNPETKSTVKPSPKPETKSETQPQSNKDAAPQAKPRTTVKPLGTVNLKRQTPPPDASKKPQTPASKTEHKPTLKPAGKKPKPITPKPAAVGIQRQDVEKDAPEGSKRETSKIPLGSATAGPQDARPKTISIKPAAPHIEKAAKPGSPTEDTDAKRQTSRISLEAVLDPDAESQPSTPKTIRLKRPSEAPTVKVKKSPETKPEDRSDDARQKTARIEVPEDEISTPKTQRKTIKVKRPSQRRNVKSVSVKRPDGAAEPAAEATQAEASTQPAVAPGIPPFPEAPVVDDSAHWTFIVTAILTVLVSAVLLYVLSAHVFDPSLSLTNPTYKPGSELPWPGRVL